MDAPAAASTAARFTSACSVCASIPSGILPVEDGSRPCPSRRPSRRRRSPGYTARARPGRDRSILPVVSSPAPLFLVDSLSSGGAGGGLMVSDSGTVFQRSDHRTARARRGRPVRSGTRDWDPYQSSISGGEAATSVPGCSARRVARLSPASRQTCVRSSRRSVVPERDPPYRTPRPPSHRWLASPAVPARRSVRTMSKVRRARLSFLAKPAICCRSIGCARPRVDDDHGSANRSRAHTCFALAEQASEEARPAHLVAVRSRHELGATAGARPCKPAAPSGGGVGRARRSCNSERDTRRQAWMGSWVRRASEYRGGHGGATL